MSEPLQVYIAALEKKVQAAALPDGCKHTAAWCLGQLPALYVKFRQSSESRFGDEISRLVQAVLTELSNSQKTCPEALKLANGIIDRLKLLHEELGIPALNLKVPWRIAAAPAKGQLIS
jgi:hypothetical protein